MPMNVKVIESCANYDKTYSLKAVSIKFDDRDNSLIITTKDGEYIFDNALQDFLYEHIFYGKLFSSPYD